MNQIGIPTNASRAHNMFGAYLKVHRRYHDSERDTHCDRLDPHSMGVAGQLSGALCRSVLYRGAVSRCPPTRMQESIPCRTGNPT